MPWETDNIFLLMAFWGLGICLAPFVLPLLAIASALIIAKVGMGICKILHRSQRKLFRNHPVLLFLVERLLDLVVLPFAILDVLAEAIVNKAVSNADRNTEESKRLAAQEAADDELSRKRNRPIGGLHSVEQMLFDGDREAIRQARKIRNRWFL